MTMRRSARCLVLLLLCPLPLFAATDTASLTGRVTIGDGPGSGVTVTATSAALLHERTTTTGPRGTYWLGALPPGAYDVTFSLAGHTTFTKKAIVELGRVARADARLEPSEDEESVTSTATTISVADTTAITTHFSDEDLDRLPLARKLPLIGTLAPVAPYFAPFAFTDDAPLFDPLFLGEEPVDEVTVIRGAVPLEYDRFTAGIIDSRTRRGGEEFFLSLRDTASRRTGDGDVQHMIETASGGHVIAEKLWFFAAGWSGDAADTSLRDLHGYELRLTSQPGAAHTIGAEYLNTKMALPGGGDDFGASTAIARYTAVAGARATAEVTASRTWYSLPVLQPVPPPRVDIDRVSAKASFFLPSRALDHVLTIGGDTTETADAVFANDRMTFARVTLDAGARWQRGDFLGQKTLPRIAATYDLRGDGRHALVASWGDAYGRFAIAPAPFRYPTSRVASLGYAAALGTSGTARADVVRVDGNNELQAEARYSLFGRIDFGATYRYEDSGGAQSANAWAGAQLPIGEHEFGVTLLERYTELLASTDLALRYSIPFPRFRLMLASDVTNVFRRETERTIRFWARLRV